MYNFDEAKHLHKVITDIKKWFELNGSGCNAVIAISGGCDSSVVAAMMIAALGRDRVFGVLMPNGYQKDLADAVDLVKYLGIKYTILDISNIEQNLLNACLIARDAWDAKWSNTSQCIMNVAPRIRMTLARAVAQNINGRYINTCNLSEYYVGFLTVDGDGTGDYGPIKDYTKTEVRKMGKLLLPERFVDKPPAAGDTDKTDEEVFGFSYEKDLDPYIRTGEIEDELIKQRIDKMHKASAFKRQPMSQCWAGLWVHEDVWEDGE